jgi:glucose dehydrogenase
MIRVEACCLLALVALGCGNPPISGSGGTGGSGGAPPTPDAGVLPAVPPEVVTYAQDWPLPGRDYANSRARLDSRITKANVANLEVAWSIPIPGWGFYSNTSTTPLIVGNTVYMQDLNSNVWAVDLATGALRWKKTYDQLQVGPSGVALGYGKLYAAKNADEIAALDPNTGQELWATRITVTQTDGIDIQPTVAGGLVFASTVPISPTGFYRGGDRGVIWALDANTGRGVWTFDTVLGNLWGNPGINSGGGAWYPPAVDIERGLIYWGTANPAPFPGNPQFPNGTSRIGDNLYTDSVVALKLQTGELAWYHQAYPHDLFDRDLVLTAMVDLSSRGINKRVAIGTGKGAHVLVLDADSGALLSKTAVGIHKNDELTELTGDTEVFPGLFGGVITPPSVADGVVYVAVLNAGNVHSPNRENYLGGAVLGQRPGQVVAVDAVDGRILWDTQVDGDPFGGTLVMGDLVFTACGNKGFALDRATGAIVRSFTLPASTNAWPAATADTIVWPLGGAPAPALVAYRIKQSP